jgi:hypothetical protein
MTQEMPDSLEIRLMPGYVPEAEIYEVLTFATEEDQTTTYHRTDPTTVAVPVEVLRQVVFALEPYDDVKPRNWVTDRKNLAEAHQLLQPFTKGERWR